MRDSIPGTSDALAESAEWFRMLFENSVDAMTLLDPETLVFVDGNDAFVRGTGIAREALGTLSFLELAPEFQPDGRSSAEAAAATLALVLANGSHRSEWLTRRADGTEEFIDVVSTRLTSGGRTLILNTARNIDGPKKVEDDLRLSEARWRRVFEQLPMSMQIFAPDGSTRQVNQAYERLFQLTMEELRDFNILHDRQLEKAGLDVSIRGAFEGQISVVPPIPFELKISPEQPAKGIRWIGSTMFPVFDPDGRILEVVCVHEDHTARRVAEDEIHQLNQTLEQRIAERTEELEVSEERFKQLFEFSPLGIAQVDQGGWFYQANPAFCELVGHSVDELKHMSYWDLTPTNFHQGQKMSIERLDRTGRFGPFDKEYIHKDGRRIPVRLNGVRVVSPEGGVQV
ncbi:MAG: PAS domain S-box protein, partial [Verrucomicrobiaceae bacterium]